MRFSWGAMYNFIDLEASGLGTGSYPIEVGVALASGETRCTLVCPAKDWQHWDDSAEHLHGITRDTLLLNGRSPLKVAILLNEWLGDAVVYSDAWGNDACWLARLFDEAGMQQRFKVEAVTSILSEAQMDLWAYAKELAERNLFLKRHRASNDALILQFTHQLLESDELSYEAIQRRADQHREMQGDPAAAKIEPEAAGGVVDISSVKALHADVQVRQLQGERSMERQLAGANDDQLLDILERKQLQY